MILQCKKTSKAMQGWPWHQAGTDGSVEQASGLWALRTTHLYSCSCSSQNSGSPFVYVIGEIWSLSMFAQIVRIDSAWFSITFILAIVVSKHCRTVDVNDHYPTTVAGNGRSFPKISCHRFKATLRRSVPGGKWGFWMLLIQVLVKKNRGMWNILHINNWWQ